MTLKLLLSFILLSSVIFAQNGLVQTLHKNGKVESEMFYIKGIIDGASKWYYYYGVLKEERNYTLGKLNGWHRKYYENGAIKEEYYYKYGKRDGIAKEFYINGGLKTYLSFDNGILKEKRSYYYDSTLAVPKIILVDKKNNTRKVITGIDTLEINNGNTNYEQISSQKIHDSLYLVATHNSAEPLGGIQVIYNKLNSSELLKQSGIQGNIIVRTYINETGDVTSSEMIKGLGGMFDETIKKIIENTKFKPGTQRGKPVKTQVNLSLNFENLSN